MKLFPQQPPPLSPRPSTICRLWAPERRFQTVQGLLHAWVTASRCHSGQQVSDWPQGSPKLSPQSRIPAVPPQGHPLWLVRPEAFFRNSAPNILLICKFTIGRQTACGHRQTPPRETREQKRCLLTPRTCSPYQKGLRTLAPGRASGERSGHDGSTLGLSKSPCAAGTRFRRHLGQREGDSKCSRQHRVVPCSGRDMAGSPEARSPGDRRQGPKATTSLRASRHTEAPGLPC